MTILSSKPVLIGRAESSSVQRQAEMLLDMELLDQLYAAVNEIVLILNRQRQIVFCNEQFAKLLGCANRSDLYGMRPGEALGCIHAGGTGGCGASPSC